MKSKKNHIIAPFLHKGHHNKPRLHTASTQKEQFYIHTKITQRMFRAFIASSRILSQNHRHLLETRQYSLDAYAPFD